VFVPGNHFQPCLLLALKAISEECSLETRKESISEREHLLKGGSLKGSVFKREHLLKGASLKGSISKREHL
jgi:hypothetical protein